MKPNVLQLVTFVLVVSLVDLSVACKNRTRQKRDDGVDFMGMAASAAGTAMEVMQQGAGVKKDFKVKIGNENNNQICIQIFEIH